MDSLNEGPHIENIPARSYQSCYRCKFYDYHLVVSGRNPKYKYMCTHNEAPNYGGVMSGNLPNKDKTPDWCPFLLLKA